MSVWRVGLCLVFAGAVAVGASSAQERSIAIRAGTLLDGTGANPVRNVLILIDGGRITAVGPDVQIPRHAEVIDLSDYTVLPGFIDAHTHLAGRIVGDGDWQHDGVVSGQADQALRGAMHAHQTLEAGFTTVRNVGAGRYSDVAHAFGSI